MAIYSGISHEKRWFSIVMLVYQRVTLWKDIEKDRGETQMFPVPCFGWKKSKQSQASTAQNPQKSSQIPPDSWLVLFSTPTMVGTYQLVDFYGCKHSYKAATASPQTHPVVTGRPFRKQMPMCWNHLARWSNSRDGWTKSSISHTPS